MTPQRADEIREAVHRAICASGVGFENREWEREVRALIDIIIDQEQRISLLEQRSLEWGADRLKGD